MNYLKNKYNTYRHFLKTSLQYCVKQKSFKMLQLLPYQFLTTKLCYSEIFKKRRKIIVADNLLLFATVKEFSKSVNS